MIVQSLLALLFLLVVSLVEIRPTGIVLWEWSGWPDVHAGCNFTCGDHVLDIKPPFFLSSSKQKPLQAGTGRCGNSSGFPLICDENNATLFINLTYRRFNFTLMHYDIVTIGMYQVKNITSFNTSDTEGGTIQLIDPGLATDTGPCPMPRYSFPYPDFSDLESPLSEIPDLPNTVSPLTWVMCRDNLTDHPGIDPADYVPLSGCNLQKMENHSNNASSSSSNDHPYHYVILRSEGAILTAGCQNIATTPSDGNRLLPRGDVRTADGSREYLKLGFTVSWWTLCGFCDYDNQGLSPSCSDFYNVAREKYLSTFPRRFGVAVVEGDQIFNDDKNLKDLKTWDPTYSGKLGLALYIVAVFILYVFLLPKIVGALCLIVFWGYKLHKKYLAKENIEVLLKTYKSLLPIQYTYAEIKIITGHFKEKLGQGGFGSVFKGNLFDGRPVAVKILKNTKGRGEDFINEVATIGTVHHVNVVRLVGFCSEGKIRILLYEFMPGGSLDRYIFSGKNNNNRNHIIGWRKMHDIALGIARGIDYLHRGCEMCILHLDIKPHNILLDHNFCPKISDFGLAKLQPTPNTMILTDPRGTPGYIAPEQIYRRGVSQKTDVYSYGMLLLEMAGMGRNADPLVPSGSSSEAYFPTWIYKRLQEGGDIEICEEGAEFEEGIVKKLAIVGLWCIETTPQRRPSMCKVIDMLEGSLDGLQLPPQLVLRSLPRTMEVEESMESSCNIDIDSMEEDISSKGFR